jgi:hypothetical protein
MIALRDGWTDICEGVPFRLEYTHCDKAVAASYENGRLIAVQALRAGFDPLPWKSGAPMPEWWHAVREIGRSAVPPMRDIDPKYLPKKEEESEEKSDE